jgi:hypothetical protein|tara:strand:- start:99 stop:659 length:561 start_codon:yes stop_codon:yes gene_type:complete
MPSDIVFPKNNEKEFLAMAGKLGYDKLIFVYSGKPSKVVSSDVKVSVGKLSNKRGDGIIVSKVDGDGRTILEHVKPSFAFGFEWEKVADKHHYRSSGMNQVLCKIAAKNETQIVVPIREILSLKGRERAQVLGRVMQNVRICKKYKVGVKLASFAHTPYQMKGVKELASFGTVLGMDSSMVKKGIE